MTDAWDWSGPVGDVWAAEWRRTDRSFAGLSVHLDAAILAAAPQRGTAVDLGCGAGQTSIALVGARPNLDVTGVDVSAALVRIAARRGADLPNLRFIHADVAAGGAGIIADADLLFSRHGVMFFTNPTAVFSILRGAVRPGAKLVFSCFRTSAHNPWATDLVRQVTGVSSAQAQGYTPGPFGFANAEWVATMLSTAGWSPPSAEPIDFTYIAGEGDDPVADAASFFARIGPVAAAMRAAPESDRPRLRKRLAAALREYRQGDQVCFPAAAWLWSAHA